MKPRKLGVWPERQREHLEKKKINFKSKNFVSKSSTLRADALQSEKILKSFKPEIKLTG